MSKVYLVDGSTMDALADIIQEKAGITSKLTPVQMIEAAKGISVGDKLPDAEGVSFSAEQITPDVRYAIGYNWFAQVVERLRVMSNNNRDFTPEEIVYWLGRVAFIPQGYAESAFELDFASGASGILPTVYKGAASSEFTLNFESTAVGVLQEE